MDSRIASSWSLSLHLGKWKEVSVFYRVMSCHVPFSQVLCRVQVLGKSVPKELQIVRGFSDPN